MSEGLTLDAAILASLTLNVVYLKQLVMQGQLQRPLTEEEMNLSKTDAAKAVDGFREIILENLSKASDG